MMDGPPFEAPPGAPDDLRTAARTFRQLAQQHDAVRSSVSRIASEASDGWSGPFADRFRECAAELAGRFKPVCEAAMETSLALTSYASALEEAQQSVAALNQQASLPDQTHGDPVARALAMSQLGRQAATIASELNTAAASCVSRTSWSTQVLQSTLPDTASSTQLLADIKRASSDLKKQNPGLWDAVFGPDGFLRTWDERLHSPADLAAADLVITRFIDTAIF
jgi:hypothetical protein